jgi:peptidoglycan L-alanyl-D-glutamate endopeptidase CwlK
MASRNIKDAHPELQRRYARLLEAFRDANPGRDLVLTCSYRSPDEQRALYARGRALVAGKWVVQDPSQIVTYLSGEPGSRSLHNLIPARAIDVAVLISGKVTWQEKEYYPLGPLAERCGLEWGGYWHQFRDYPHLQLPKEVA